MKLTILMYHKIDEPAAGVRFPGNYVVPEHFERQMRSLLDWGYETIAFDQWLDYRASRAALLPRKPLIVTFDDGYTCFDRNAWPVLRSLGMSATVFLVAGQIGGTNAWDRDERQERLLDAERIGVLQSEGVSFGSHSYTHPPLAKVAPARALEELTRSRAELGALLGRDVNVFAYPFSNQNSLVRDLARQAGYQCAVRGKGRMNWRHTDPFGLRRIKVEHDMTIDELSRKLLRERYLRVL
jgi:peptidoglycan/xylan/chitin deacetylase (PgdA/CDA1 family)